MKKILVNVADLVIGKKGEIVIQSMTNTPTTNIEATYNQCVALSKAGAQLVRVTTQGIKEVEALAKIKQRLREDGIETPLVADVHFSYNIAHAAARVADKVRINPGNFAKEPNVAKREFSKLITICKEYKTSLRIGVNHGSMGEYNTLKYGNSPAGMAAVAYDWIEMSKSNDFRQIVLSLKASNPIVMTQAYTLLYNKMEQSGTLYPLHLGVTEAGNGDEGRIKSALGIATLLKRGVGDTIRVSLTETPINEIPVAQLIVNHFRKSSGKESTSKNLYICDSYEQFIIEASCDWGPPLLEKEIDNIEISAIIDGKELSKESLNLFKENLLQAARRKFTKPEYIACPGCGRTLYNLEETFAEVKRRTSHLVGYKIAVMGCIVNGPGEMADADYGYVGEGMGKVSIYRGKSVVYRSVPQEEAIDKLLSLIEEDSRNRVFLPHNE